MSLNLSRIFSFLPIFFFLLGTAWANSFTTAPADFEVTKLLSRNGRLQWVAEQAKQYKVTFGIYGGTVRDLYLKRPFSPISDFDLIYDSSEEGMASLSQCAAQNACLTSARSYTRLSLGLESKGRRFCAAAGLPRTRYHSHKDWIALGWTRSRSNRTWF